MKASPSIDMSLITKRFGSFFGKYHLTVSIVLIVAGLALAVLFLNRILTDSATDDSYVSPINAGSIDQATLQRLNQLQPSTEATPALVLPDGRINPFAE